MSAGVAEAAAGGGRSTGGSSANATAGVGAWIAPPTVSSGRRRIDDLPSGTVVVDDDRGARLVIDDRLLAFTFDGWTDPIDRPRKGTVHVLTPPTSVAALANGFTPLLHPSASPEHLQMCEDSGRR